MLWRVLTICLVLAGAVRAEGERAGDFDYYVLALSWTPSFCDLEGDRKGRAQCDAGRGHGFTLHGLWPQYETGWPSYCKNAERPPSRAMTGAMSDIMGSSGLAWHQWKKHGSCAGISAAEYYSLSRKAYEMVTRPPVFRKLTEEVRLPARVVEDAFLQSNPQFEADGVTITCKRDFIQEVRICLNKNLEPRRCGSDVRRDCTQSKARMGAIR